MKVFWILLAALSVAACGLLGWLIVQKRGQPVPKMKGLQRPDVVVWMH